MLSLESLTQGRCTPVTKDTKAMLIPTIESHLSLLPNWQATFDYKAIERQITFKNYHYVMAFLNALAYLCHQQDYYPTVEYRYNSVKLKLRTEPVNGVTNNDMIMAAKIEALLAN